VAVAANLLMSSLVANLGMGVNPTNNLSFQRLDQQSVSAFPENLAQVMVAVVR
jgi:hypothetical protein